MAIPLLALLPAVSTLLDRLLPDKNANDAAKLKLMELAQAGELAHLEAESAAVKGQLAVNQVEAGSASMFVAGWRPWIGWVCGMAFAWNWIGLPVASFVAAYLGHAVALEPADLSEMMPVLLGMLGIGAMRSYEKVKGVAAGMGK